MPDLRCTVQTCTHNQNYYCKLDNIVVGGSAAKNAEETSCDSFEERKGEGAYMDAYSDSTGKEASAKCGVDCKAMDCMYNKDCQCHAGKISVEGGNACHCGETECATFKCGCAQIKNKKKISAVVKLE